MLSHFSQVWFFVTLWAVACQGPLSMGFSRKNYWSGLPCLAPGGLPNSGIEPASLSLLHWQLGFLPPVPPEKPFLDTNCLLNKGLSLQKKKESSRKTSISALLTTPKPLTVWITTNCGKFLKRWEHQTTWPASLRNLYTGQEATVRTGHGTTHWFQIRKGVQQGCILSPCLFNLYVEYIMLNARLDKAHTGIKIAGRNINNLMTDDTILIAEGKVELKSLLMKV